MMKRRLPLQVLFWIASGGSSALAMSAQNPLTQFIHNNRLVVVPLTLQNSLHPGTIVAVEKHGHSVLGAQTFQPPPTLQVPNATAFTGQANLDNYLSAGGSINLGTLNPGATFTSSSGWQVSQVDFETQEMNDQKVIDDYVQKDPVANGALNEFRVPVSGQLQGFDRNYTLYIVTGVFATKKLNVKSSNGYGLHLRNNGSAADCSTQQGKNNLAAGGTTIGPGQYAVSVKVCHNADGSYDLSHDPAVPLGVRLEEITINRNNQPEARGVDYRQPQLQ